MDQAFSTIVIIGLFLNLQLPTPVGLSVIRMPANIPHFEAWEEQVICQERGSRVVHYYLKNTSGTSILAVVGTERSIRHMFYVVSDEFLHAYGGDTSVNVCTKWRARREVVDWLTSVISHPLDITSMYCLNLQSIRFHY